jgi:hypothetical protein
MQLPAQMCKTPSVTKIGSWTLVNGSNPDIDSISLAYGGTWVVLTASATGLVQNTFAQLRAGGVGATLVFSAQL